MTLRADARRPSFLAAGLCLVAIALLPLGVALGAQYAPAATGPVAALFPPWWTARHAFAAAGAAGPVLRLGGLPFIVIVAPDDRARLRASGAWLLVDPRAPGICTPPTPGVI
ncbi:MAG: hypothetical protein KGJ41_00085 [Rhodospirillales bacterium]|nr:hypothetical protein [Rhodospirillales bacterium]MDE2576858.1 hypothetical protein [Rhodospirillales bacterium]